MFGDRNFYLFICSLLLANKNKIIKWNCHFDGNAFHHCHNTQSALGHVNADVGTQKLCCPQTESEL